MDHGPPVQPGSSVWYCSDEHTVFAPEDGAPLPAVGDRLPFLPAHVDPTCALHEQMWVVVGEEVVDCWAVDVRNW